MISEKEVSIIKDELENCQSPFFFFHDDPDGFASFLLLYRFKKEGYFTCVKSSPNIAADLFSRKVIDSGADKVFVLDIANVEQDFVDIIKLPVIWIDHHDPQDVEKVKYFNPRVHGINVPTSELCWNVVCKERPQDLWLAVLGCVGDWHMPSFASALCSASPDILPHTGNVDDILFDSEFGTLVKVMAFNLKGSTSDVKKSIRVFSKIESPYEILNQSTPKGKFLWKRFEKINRTYTALLKSAIEVEPRNDVFVFTYSDDSTSVTKDLANELLYKKGCVVVVGRERMGELRCSVRSPSDIDLNDFIPDAMRGLNGRFGGHEQAMGLVVSKEDFDQFIKNLTDRVKKLK